MNYNTDMENLPQPGQNTGVIEKSPILGDFIAGSETGIIDQVHVSSGDWRNWLPTDETQLLKATTALYGTQAYLETNACVTFSGNNALEMFGDQQIASGAWSKESVDWLKENGYFDDNGKLNFSDRFTAKMSNTDPNGGNSLPGVWASRKNDGLVPEKVWPMPSDIVAQWVESGVEFTQKSLQDLYYAEVSGPVIDLGKEFAKRFDISYEFIKYPGYGTVDTLRQSLRMAPLQVATAVCHGWNTDNPINSCGAGSQHATCVVNIEDDGTFDIYDHYNPFSKRFSSAYDITYAMRAVISPKEPPQPEKPFHYVFNLNLVYGQVASPEIHKLQEALQFLKRSDGTSYMKKGVFGPFGPQTAAALDLFQRDNSIIDPEPGHNFGPKTRKAMNSKLSI